jgi:hypothetical protein
VTPKQQKNWVAAGQLIALSIKGTNCPLNEGLPRPTNQTNNPHIFGFPCCAISPADQIPSQKHF